MTASWRCGEGKEKRGGERREGSEENPATQEPERRYA